MVGVKKSITTVIVALAVAPVVHADMMPVSPLEGGSRWSLSVSGPTAAQRASDSQGLVTFGAGIDLGFLPVASLPAVKPDAGNAGDAKHVRVLADRHSSLSLCLYGLLGLGLFRSATFVRKFHLSCIPDWYCADGPQQIGHSFAIAPDCLSSVPVRCFIQPDFPAVAEDSLPAFRGGIVASLWRESQFTVATVPSRGPPPMS